GGRLGLAGNALATWPGPEALSDSDHELAMLLVGPPRASSRAADGEHRTVGYTIWRARDLVVAFDHGPLGLAPMAAHGHADALAVTLHCGANAIVADPGTFAYHDDR